MEFYLSFIWLSSLEIMSSRFIHVVASVKLSLLLKAELYLMHIKPHLVFHPFFDGFLGLFLLPSGSCG